jgi:hypothetical protein
MPVLAMMPTWPDAVMMPSEPTKNTKSPGQTCCRDAGADGPLLARTIRSVQPEWRSSNESAAAPIGGYVRAFTMDGSHMK